MSLRVLQKADVSFKVGILRRLYFFPKAIYQGECWVEENRREDSVRGTSWGTEQGGEGGKWILEGQTEDTSPESITKRCSVLVKVGGGENGLQL